MPSGPAWIGADRPNEGPAQKLYVEAFFIDCDAISNREFARFMADDGYSRPELWQPEGFEWVSANAITQPAYWEDERFNQPDQPVTGVSFHEAAAFAAWAGGRLPTEIEWEKAARGDDGRTFPWGEHEPDLGCAQFAPGFSPVDMTTKPIDAFAAYPSPYGCRQMSGNVFEWCSDFFHIDTPERRLRDPDYPTRPGSRRVLKGGAWHTGANRLRASARWSFTPDLRDNVVGIRVVYDA